MIGKIKKKINIKKSFLIFIALNYILYILFLLFKVVLLPLIIVFLFKDKTNITANSLGSLFLIVHSYINVVSNIFLALGIIILLMSFIRKDSSLVFTSLLCIILFSIKLIIFAL